MAYYLTMISPPYDIFLIILKSKYKNKNKIKKEKK